ncbi:KpsF/GutQ family sugar-phosphate isomerase [Prochlorococcus sp. AH-736-B04]|nr:KpsF/GutQ family sugar-phosphate isomerase [Prochlorococcus sp. AH-736-B04]
MRPTERIKEAQRVLEAEARAIFASSKKISLNFSKCIDLIIDCKGTVVISGIGKSGNIGKKITSTLASLGTPSIFLHTSDAFHGDLGILRKDDLLICISNSGETDELVRLLNYAKRNGIQSIAITGNVNSTISKEASISLNSSVESEACPLNLAPTCSTSVTMALGDALASICAMERGFKEIDFARFHPSGSLHKLNFETVENIMNTESLPICEKNTSIKDVIIAISKGQQGAVFVCEKQKLLWVFTDGDLRRCIESGIKLTANIKDLKFSLPLTTKSFSKVSEALDLMQSNNISILPVIDDCGLLIGSVKLSQCI